MDAEKRRVMLRVPDHVVAEIERALERTERERDAALARAEQAATGDSVDALLEMRAELAAEQAAKGGGK